MHVRENLRDLKRN